MTICGDSSTFLVISMSFNYILWLRIFEAFFLSAAESFHISAIIASHSLLLNMDYAFKHLSKSVLLKKSFSAMLFLQVFKEMAPFL